VENATGVSLGELIDFCARSVALGIPESTKLRAVADGHAALVAVFAESQLATPSEVVNSPNPEYGMIIEGGVIIDIPGEE
jgi:hypothetical protein